MPAITINRCKTAIYYGHSMRHCVGDLIETVHYSADFLPRVGNIITVHPEGEPSEKSWTAKVTGVQHVFTHGRPPRACLTAIDEKEIQRL
jgi:hypothetical protein